MKPQFKNAITISEMQKLTADESADWEMQTVYELKI